MKSKPSPKPQALADIDREKLVYALVESVRLQAHYAGLLNSYDGGRRIVFKDAQEWIARLKSMGAL